MYLLALVSLQRDRLQCLLGDQHQLSVLPADAVTDQLAKHPCPPGWQLVFSQINPPPPSLYPLQPQLRPTRIVCTWPASLTMKNFGDRESIKPGAEENIPFSVWQEYFNSDLYSGCAWFESVVHTRSPETSSSSFWVPWLNHKTGLFVISCPKSLFVILTLTHATLPKFCSILSVIKRLMNKWISKRFTQSVM